jgi:hypothetical protein
MGTDPSTHLQKLSFKKSFNFLFLKNRVLKLPLYKNKG